MKEIKTSCGVTVTVDETVFDDMEMLDRLLEFQQGQYESLPLIIRDILGDQKKAVYDALRDERGRVPTKAFGAVFDEILSEALPKNA